MLPRLLLDTHVVVQWLIDAKRLSREQKSTLDRAIQRTEPVGLSAITLLEIAVLVSERKLILKAGLDQFFDDLRSGPAFKIFPLTFEIAAEVALLGNLRDPADKTIVATARVHRLQLVTSDTRIAESKLVQIVD